MRFTKLSSNALRETTPFATWLKPLKISKKNHVSMSLWVVKLT